MPDPDATLARLSEALAEGRKVYEEQLAYVSDEGLSEVVALEMARLRGLEEGHLESDLFDAVAAQSPELLTPHLEEVLALLQRLKPIARASAWWNGCTSPNILAALRGHTFDESISPMARLLMWTALIASRDHDALIYVAEHGEFCRATAAEAYGWTGKWQPASIREYIWSGANMDWDAERGELRALLPKGAYHLRFEERFEESIDKLYREPEHPSWSTERPADAGGWHGGAVAEDRCLACRHALIDIVTLSEIPNDLGVTGLGSLRLTTCLHCFPWPQDWLFFHHEANGKTIMLSDELEKVDPADIHRSMEALPKGDLFLVESDPRWRHQRGTRGENLHRFGGTPNWIQDAAYRACPRCAKTMPFLLQMGDHFPGISEWAGDTGQAYIFWCDDCKISGWHCDNY